MVGSTSSFRHTPHADRAFSADVLGPPYVGTGRQGKRADVGCGDGRVRVARRTVPDAVGGARSSLATMWRCGGARPPRPAAGTRSGAPPYAGSPAAARAG